MFSKDKGKSKKRRDHKSTSKSGTSAKPTTSTGEEPENLGFLYSIDALETSYDDKHPTRILSIGGSKGNDIARLWFPPIRKYQFKRRPGHIYRWPGEEESEKLEGDKRPENLKKFHVASVFFQAKQDNFLAVFKDCARHDIANEDFGWSQIGFHHHSGLSEVDIGGERHLLAAPAKGSSWMPQVIPEVYNYDTKSPSATPFTGQHGGLCGKLSLLIAMAAFSAPVHEAEDIVSKCFGYKTWEKHSFETGIGRYQERGVIVTIYLDPEAEGVTATHLKEFEEGKYGPIFAPPWPSLTPQAPAYTHQQAAIPAPYGPASAIPRNLAFPYQIPAAPGGYSASTGYTATSGYPAPQMIIPPPELYNAEDDEPEEKKD